MLVIDYSNFLRHHELPQSMKSISENNSIPKISILVMKARELSNGGSVLKEVLLRISPSSYAPPQLPLLLLQIVDVHVSILPSLPHQKMQPPAAVEHRLPVPEPPVVVVARVAEGRDPLHRAPLAPMLVVPAYHDLLRQRVHEPDRTVRDPNHLSPVRSSRSWIGPGIISASCFSTSNATVVAASSPSQ